MLLGQLAISHGVTAIDRHCLVDGVVSIDRFKAEILEVASGSVSQHADVERGLVLKHRSNG